MQAVRMARAAGDPRVEPVGMAEPHYRPGSTEDFDRLYRDTYSRLLGTLTGVLRDHAAAEDCVQEAYTRAFRHWKDWKPEAPAEAWLHRIALNVAFGERKRQRLREIGEVIRRFGVPRGERDPAGSDQIDLLAALRRLPPEQAAAIILRHLHGYTNREIGIALGVPERTVASRLAAAKQRLRNELGPGFFEGASSTLPRSAVVRDE
jgi:RNA polymerase sigma-70 factor, ECF subfamily